MCLRKDKAQTPFLRQFPHPRYSAFPGSTFLSSSPHDTGIREPRILLHPRKVVNILNVCAQVSRTIGKGRAHFELAVEYITSESCTRSIFCMYLHILVHSRTPPMCLYHPDTAMMVHERASSNHPLANTNAKPDSTSRSPFFAHFYRLTKTSGMVTSCYPAMNRTRPHPNVHMSHLL